MAREQELLAAFTEFADTFIDDYDVVDFLHRLATRCVELVDAAEAGVMLADRDGTLHYVASSSERMRIIELFELQHDEGPCLDAYRDNVAIHVDLSDADARWPHFAQRARDDGFASVSALPMRLRGEVIGALNVFSANATALDEADRMLAQSLADIATIGILQQRALNDARVVTSQLESALGSRIAIEQAKGIVAERRGVTVDGAFTLLRNHARNNNLMLQQVALEIIDGSLSTEVLPEEAPAPHA